MTTAPLTLTIGIPTFNGAGNLANVVNSISKLNLHYHRFEILIVDNNSDDDTEQVVNGLQLVHKNIIFHKNDINIGRIENWNKVISLAQGEFLIIMNVNDQFMSTQLGSYLNYLLQHPEIPLVMNDVLFNNFRYPNWMESGVVDLGSYITKTFLEIDLLEFNSLGVLQQHIFRMTPIRQYHIEFDPSIPRTTDRVFTAQVIKQGGGRFYYTGHPIVNWQLTTTRYHHQAHNNVSQESFNALWGNEYEANTKLGEMVNIPQSELLKSQLISAKFMMYAKWFRNIKNKIFGLRAADQGIEISTAHLYYDHLQDQAQKLGMSINYGVVKLVALKRAITWFLRSINLYPKAQRSIQNTFVNNPRNIKVNYV